MKLLHLSDLHIGKQLNGFSLLEDQRHMLQSIVQLATDTNTDAILLSGDIYDKSQPSSAATELVGWFFDELAHRHITLCAIPGNHDSAERIAYASQSLQLVGLNLAGPYAGRVHCIQLTDAHGTVCIWLFPFVRPAQVRAFHEDRCIDTYTQALEACVSTCALDRNLRNIALVHQFVISGGKEPERSDSELCIGGLDVVEASVFDAFDYVALGHIHKPQKVGRDTLRYCGTPLKYSVSEALHHKSIPLITLGAKGDVSVELKTIQPLHDLRVLTGPLDELLAPGNLEQHNTEDYLYVRLTDKTLPSNALSRLRAHFPRLLGMELVQNASPSHTQALQPSHSEQSSPFELFSRFYKDQTGLELDVDQSSLIESLLAATNQED